MYRLHGVALVACLYENHSRCVDSLQGKYPEQIYAQNSWFISNTRTLFFWSASSRAMCVQTGLSSCWDILATFRTDPVGRVSHLRLESPPFRNTPSITRNCAWGTAKSISNVRHTKKLCDCHTCLVAHFEWNHAVVAWKLSVIKTSWSMCCAPKPHQQVQK